MVEIGYKISSEEHPPGALVEHARRAEAAGFSFAAISDHYHPWIDRQGQSPFVWGVLGGIAQATTRLRVTTAVTCPTIRVHPAIIAQAAATASAMMPGRFMLGVGTGEKLNEHILGTHWPSVDVRAEMLAEAVDVIRALWQGGMTSHRGHHYTVENARLYTLPEELPPIYVAAGGPESAKLAGRIGDGLISVGPDAKVVEAFESAGGQHKPRLAEMAVCWAPDERQARKAAHTYWPIAGIQGALQQELPLPQHFEQVGQTVREDDVAEMVVVGPEPERYVAKVQEYVDAGFGHVWLHQIGPDQEGFFRFYETELASRLRRLGATAARRERVAVGGDGG
jgi:coenzyme F420-dependent glucose-6-phosphate dehydrogenase